MENIAIPCNTSHYFLEDIQKSTSVPIINMVEESVRYVVEAHPKSEEDRDHGNRWNDAGKRLTTEPAKNLESHR